MAQALLLPLVFAAILGVLGFGVTGDPVEDKQALLDFASAVSHGRDLNWNLSTVVCGGWSGVTCSTDGSRVIALRLPGIGFNGPLPPNTLSRLSALQALSLASNGLTGYFPLDFANLTALTVLYLQLNNFSGPLPGDFSPWKNLTVIDLSFNDFNGSIPASVSNLTQLVDLNLSNNSLSGQIPDLDLPNLQFLDLSNNNLNGTIPETLMKFPSPSFSGNDLLPPYTLAPSFAPLPMSPSASPIPSSRRMKNLSEFAMLGIIIGGCAILFAMLALFLCLCCRRRKEDTLESGKGSKGDRSPEKIVRGDKDQSNRIVFFEGCSFAFDLEDLLRASAEVLGKGTFGTAYKAVLEDAIVIAVKRLKDISVGKKDFEQQMELVGQIKHENVVELRAYYYSKDEKLMVYDYFTNGSVFSMLHTKGVEGRTHLGWETRLKIALGAARGLAYIHTENNGKLVHGNIKSSNVFLNRRQYGCISDLGLASLANPTVRPIARTAGYAAPEVVYPRKATQASDVYSFGVLMLELLTGKSPIHTVGGGVEVVHLVRWVQSVVREEWTAEVFDLELMKYPNIEEEMVEMLQIAMSCVARIPEQRPKMADVVRMMQGVRRFDGENRSSAELRSEGSTATSVQDSGAMQMARQS